MNYFLHTSTDKFITQIHSICFVIIGTLKPLATIDNNAFMLSTLPVPSQSQSNFGTTSTTYTSTPSTSTHLSAPSEVSQNTAISDRPKVKPVSKKDGKNMRKAAAAAAANNTANASPLASIGQPNQLVCGTWTIVWCIV